MKATELLSKEEILYFSGKSDAAAVRVLLFSWGMIAAIFTMVALWTNPLTIGLAILLLGGRQLGLGVIMHECGHGTLFTRWKHNRFVGQWLAAAFIFNNCKAYRIGHAKHHRHGGTKKDPDLPNYAAYAVTRKSFTRKILRDITGLTGLKIFFYSTKMLGLKAMLSGFAANTALWAVLYATGNGWLYLLWPAAWLTSYMLYMRLRNAAEHAAVPDLYDPDPCLHTRTTYARWWERLTVAPNQVNFHIEHHILASVPCYHLREFHFFLKDKGLLKKADLPVGYWKVIRQLVLPSFDAKAGGDTIHA